MKPLALLHQFLDSIDAPRTEIRNPVRDRTIVDVMVTSDKHPNVMDVDHSFRFVFDYEGNYIRHRILHEHT